MARSSLTISLHASLSFTTPAMVLINASWSVNSGVSIWECRSRVCPYFSSGTLHVLFVLLAWFLRWEVSDYTVAILRGVASWGCSKKHVPFLYSSHLAFSPSVALASWWCIHTVALIPPQLGRNHVLSYLGDQVSIWLLTCQLQPTPLLGVAYVLVAAYALKKGY